MIDKEEFADNATKIALTLVKVFIAAAEKHDDICLAYAGLMQAATDLTLGAVKNVENPMPASVAKKIGGHFKDIGESMIEVSSPDKEGELTTKEKENIDMVVKKVSSVVPEDISANIGAALKSLALLSDKHEAFPLIVGMMTALDGMEAKGNKGMRKNIKNWHKRAVNGARSWELDLKVN